jgi:hypothetical protein
VEVEEEVVRQVVVVVQEHQGQEVLRVHQELVEVVELQGLVVQVVVQELAVVVVHLAHLA